MGHLRTEPKARPVLSEDEYSNYLGILSNARNAAQDHHVYWDLEAGENAARIRKAFLHIASKEGIPVIIRRERGKNSLAFNFKDSSRKSGSSRMSAAECRTRIMEALQQARRPLQKGDIITATGISPSTWNIRIKELIKAGLVVRDGDRRDTIYSLPKK